MIVSYHEIKPENISELVRASSKFGIPRGENWLRRCLWDPCVCGLVEDSARGHMAQLPDGEVVAVECYFYLPCFFKQEKRVCHSACIMGADPKYSAEFLRVLHLNSKKVAGVCAEAFNCISNQKSVDVQRLFYRRREPSYRSDSSGTAAADFAMYPLAAVWRLMKCPPTWLEKVVWCLSRPFSWCMRAWRMLLYDHNGYKVNCYHEIDLARFGEFWERFLSANTGLITSREPRRLEWLFGDSLRAGTITILGAEKSDKLDGYVIVRLCLDGHWAKTYEIMDICAVRNNVKILRVLVSSAIQYVGKLGGIKLVYQGCVPNQEQWLDPYFKRRKRSFPTYLYKTQDPQIQESIEKGEGWFLGPFDGERCLGHGGLVDV